MLQIKTLTESTNTKVYFKIALGSKESRSYSRPLTKDLFNKISKSLKTYKIYLSVHADNSNSFKQLDYRWIEISQADKVDDTQKELFIYGCQFFKDCNKLNKDSISLTIYVDELSDDIISQIQWQESTSKSSSFASTF